MGKKKQNKRNHIFLPGTPIVSLSNFENIRKGYPEYYYPKLGDVLIVSTFKRYHQKHWLGQKPAGLVWIEPNPNNDDYQPIVPICSYNFRLATKSEIEQLITTTKVEWYVNRMARLALEKVKFPIVIGTTGLNVYWLQRLLSVIYRKEEVIELDGIYGPHTQSFVWKFFKQQISSITESNIKSLERAVRHITNN